MKEDKEAVVVEVGRWKVGILRGLQLFGHKNGLKTLLKLGPLLWSGADDGSIRLWRCMDGDCIEVVEDAHVGSVNKPLTAVFQHVQDKYCYFSFTHIHNIYVNGLTLGRRQPRRLRHGTAAPNGPRTQSENGTSESGNTNLWQSFGKATDLGQRTRTEALASTKPRP